MMDLVVGRWRRGNGWCWRAEEIHESGFLVLSRSAHSISGGALARPISATVAPGAAARSADDRDVGQSPTAATAHVSGMVQTCLDLCTARCTCRESANYGRLTRVH